jgi:hypothetical protein
MPCIKKMGISSLPWSPIVSLRAEASENDKTDHATYTRPVASSPDLIRNNVASPLVAKRRPLANPPRSPSTRPSRALLIDLESPWPKSPSRGPWPTRSLPPPSLGFRTRGVWTMQSRLWTSSCRTRTRRRSVRHIRSARLSGIPECARSSSSWHRRCQLYDPNCIAQYAQMYQCLISSDRLNTPQSNSRTVVITP